MPGILQENALLFFHVVSDRHSSPATCQDTGFRVRCMDDVAF
jgi:hypothetical protein